MQVPEWWRSPALTMCVATVAAALVGGTTTVTRLLPPAGAVVVGAVTAGLTLLVGQIISRSEDRRERDQAWTESFDDVDEPPEDDGLATAMVLLDPWLSPVRFNLVAKPWLDRLVSWCLAAGSSGGADQRTDDVPVAVLDGRPGSGKTRLAAEVAAELRARGWRCGVLRTGQTVDAAVSAAADLRSPVLVIVDPAETVDLAVPFAAAAARRREGGPVRVLLVVRDAAAFNDVAVDAWPIEISAPVRNSLRVTVGPLAHDEHGQRQLFEQAAATYAAAGVGEVPDPGTQPALPVSFTPLLVHAAALLACKRSQGPAAERAERTEWNPGEVIAELLDAEADHWLAKAQEVGCSLRPGQLRRILTISTLLGGGTADGMAALISLTGGIADQAACDAATRWLKIVYPQVIGGPARSPRLPGRIADHLVASELQADPEFPTRLVAAASDDRCRRMLTVLAAAAREEPHAAAALAACVAADPGRLLVIALGVARSVGVADVDVPLSHAVKQAKLPHGLARAALESLPATTITVAATAVTLASRLVNVSTDPTDRARWLGKLGNRLAGIGSLDRALDAAAMSVDGWRTLAAADRPAHLAGLADGLSNLGNRLSEVGAHEEALAAAEEATELRRQLAAGEPEAHLPKLAGSFSNLANRLTALGRFEQALAAAEQAVGLWRTLGGSHHDLHDAGLAGGLTNLGSKLAEMGRYEEAEKADAEAVDRWRALTAADRDTHLPELAGALINQATRTKDVGRPEVAVVVSDEAVVLCRHLARSRPLAYQAKLALALANLSNHLAGAKEHKRGLLAAEEAVELWREVNKRQHATQRPGLARALSSLAGFLGEAGQPEQAASAAGESVELWRELVAVHRRAHLSSLARALNNYGNAGRDDEATAALHEAIGLWRELVSGCRAAHQRGLAASLANLGSRVGERGDYVEAVALVGEAVHHYRELDALRTGMYAAEFRSAERLLDWMERPAISPDNAANHG